MLRALAAVLTLFALAVPASAGASQSFEGSWRPPPGATVDQYRVTVVEGEEFVGRLTDGVLLCDGAPDLGDEFWRATQSGSLNGGGIYDGTTVQFVHDGDTCTTTTVFASFWPLADDRLRVCPNTQEMDLKSPLDHSETCTDFVRTDDPLQVKPHTARDYIPKITRDEDTCKTDYNVSLTFVDDDPMNDVKIFTKRKGKAFKRFPNNPLFLPLKTDADQTRILDFRWIKKGPLTVKAVIKTQSGKTFKRKRKFSACV